MICSCTDNFTPNPGILSGGNSVELAQARAAAETFFNEGTNAESVLWRDFQKAHPSARSSVSASRRPGRDGWLITAGSRTLLFDRYSVTLVERMTLDNDLAITSKDEPVIYVSELKNILKHADGGRSVNYASNSANLNADDWRQWRETGFSSDLPDLPIRTNQPIKNAQEYLQFF